MKYLTTIIKNLLMSKKLEKPVGRWSIENCNTKLNNRIDLSNEDHCGPCGQYALTKTETTKPKTIDNHLEKKD